MYISNYRPEYVIHTFFRIIPQELIENNSILDFSIAILD